MTPDQTVALLLAGAAIITLGWMVLQCVSSARAETREARRLEEADDLARTEAWFEQLRQADYDESVTQSLAVAEHTSEALARVEYLPGLRVVPQQRDGRTS